MGDDRNAAAQADRGDWSANCRAFRMGGGAADDAQHALAQRKSELPPSRGGIVDEAVDHQRRVGADIQRRLVDEQDLHAAGRGGLDLLVLDHLRPDLDHSGAPPGSVPEEVVLTAAAAPTVSA